MSEYKKRSVVHKYFQHENAQASKCNICKVQIKTPNGNPTTLRQHLNNKHATQYTEMLQKEGELKNNKARKLRSNKIKVKSKFISGN